MRLSLKSFGNWQAVSEVLVEEFPFVLGRDGDCNCTLPFAFISRRHCVFEARESIVYVRDLGSYSGTLLNGRPLSESTALKHGDELTLGPLSFRITIAAKMPETAHDCCLPATCEIPAEAMVSDPPAANNKVVTGLRNSA
jgi:predicted component of type VI protein secretion system